MAINDAMEFGSVRRAPGSAHNRIVWTGTPPWWLDRTDYAGIGVHLDKIANAAQAFDALGKYTLAKAPAYCYPTRDENGKPVRAKIANRYAIVRSDTKLPLDDVIVSGTYSIIQPEAAFDAADEIVKGRGAEYEVMGELAGGRDLWATLRLDTSIVVAGETIKPYLLFYTSHDGSSSAQFANVTERPECRNTLQLGLRERTQRVTIRHSGNADAKLSAAAKVMREALGYMTEFEKFANELARKPFGRTEYGLLIDKLFAMPEDKGRAQTNAIKARERFMETVLADNLNDLRNTAWGALNAVSDYNEHVKPIRNGTTDQAVKLERLFRRSFEDTALVNKAQEIIMELVR
jgi:phage/plasmid-like protein (TIGR03299 family)